MVGEQLPQAQRHQVGRVLLQIAWAARRRTGTGRRAAPPTASGAPAGRARRRGWRRSRRVPPPRSTAAQSAPRQGSPVIRLILRSHPGLPRTRRRCPPRRGRRRRHRSRTRLLPLRCRWPRRRSSQNGVPFSAACESASDCAADSAVDAGAAGWFCCCATACDAGEGCPARIVAGGGARARLLLEPRRRCCCRRRRCSRRRRRPHHRSRR